MTTASTFDTTLSGLGIARTGAAATANVSAAGATQTLGQGDFLKLMTAQLKNQDPFNPVDNTQMVAQMAQFSSVAGIAQMNTTLNGIAGKLGVTSTSDAMAYVGKTVLTAGDTAYPRAAGGIAGKIELADDATDVNVTIADKSGNVLKTLSLGRQAKGTIDYDWDGATSDGTATGPFTISVAARGGGGTVAATGLVWAPVESVSLASGSEPVLNVTGLGPVKVADVRAAG